uniref:Uncharacterized protein n=1 Tax=Picea sitchensis TaxID=3332 RepID=A9P245_PICSI|nr:unknown [Picea sitchensis]
MNRRPSFPTRPCLLSRQKCVRISWNFTEKRVEEEGRAAHSHPWW